MKCSEDWIIIGKFINEHGTEKEHSAWINIRAEVAKLNIELAGGTAAIRTRLRERIDSTLMSGLLECKAKMKKSYEKNSLVKRINNGKQKFDKRKKTKNQCDGCLRDLPLNELNVHVESPNSYPYMGCTKNLYEEKGD